MDEELKGEQCFCLRKLVRAWVQGCVWAPPVLILEALLQENAELQQ